MTMTMPTLPEAVHYLYTRKRADRYLAHCLDFDIVVGAPTADEAEDRLDTLVIDYVQLALSEPNNYEMLMDASAPKEFWKEYMEAFAAGRVRPSKRPVLMIQVPGEAQEGEDDTPEREIAILSVQLAAA